MKKLKLIGIVSLVAVLLTGAVQPVLAHEGHVEHDSRLKEAATRVKETTNQAANEAAKSLSDEEQQNLKQRLEAQREQIKERRQAMKEKLTKLRQGGKQKLEGKRLQTCEKREKRINTLIDRSAQNSKERLQYLQKVEASLKNFYQKNNLSNDQYEGLLATINEKETEAIAAVEAFASEEYTCSTVNAQKPIELLREMTSNRREAMTEYRKSVKELLQLVRQTVKANQGGA